MNTNLRNQLLALPITNSLSLHDKAAIIDNIILGGSPWSIQRFVDTYGLQYNVVRYYVRKLRTELQTLALQGFVLPNNTEQW
jgi:hypothetical protein